MSEETTVARAAGVAATILTAENGFEAFGKDSQPSPEMIAWVVAATLAKELEGRLSEEENAQLALAREAENARREVLLQRAAEHGPDGDTPEISQPTAAASEPTESLESAVGSLPRAQQGVASLSRWADRGLAGRGEEAILLHRVFKLMEESGEVATALIGVLGANPRKGVTHEMSAVKEELLDVALTALGAYDHIDGNQGNSVPDLLQKIERVAQRAGAFES